MKGRFIVKRGGHYVLHTDFDEIGLPFDELISFEPEAPEPPHTPEEHAEIESYTEMMRDLLRRNRACSN